MSIRKSTTCAATQASMNWSGALALSDSIGRWEHKKKYDSGTLATD
jgi:hypothetical protein